MPDGKSVFQNLLCAVAGALITGLFTMHINDQKNQLEQEKLDLQRELQQQQNLKASAEAARVSQEQFERDLSQRKQEHLGDIKDVTARMAGKYWTVVVTSHCEGPVEMALNYEALDGIRITQGWYTILPEHPTPTIDTRAAQTFYYARKGINPKVSETPQVGYANHFPWDWSTSFVYLEQERYGQMAPGGGEFQAFLIRGKDWGNQPLELNCDSFVAAPFRR
jgi:hypothetical protein